MSRENPIYPKMPPEKCHGCSRRYLKSEAVLRECPDCQTQRYCKAKTTNCRDFGYVYKAHDSDKLECPQCGEPRLCTRKHAHNWGYEVCQVHGAGSPAKGRFGGRPTKDTRPRGPSLPTERMQERFYEAMADPHLLSARQDIAVARSFLHELYEVGAMPPPRAWKRVRQAWTAMEATLTITDPERRVREFTKATMELREAIEEADKAA